jgi:hypothetical protein
MPTGKRQMATTSASSLVIEPARSGAATTAQVARSGTK